MSKRIMIYIIGMSVLTLGQSLFVQAGFGAGAYDSLCVGLSANTVLSAGAWVSVNSVVMMFISALLEKRRLNPTVLISSVVFGVLFDLWNKLLSSVIPLQLPLRDRVFLCLCALLLAPLGTAIYFTSNISKSALDEIIIAIKNAFGLPIWIAKNMMEVLMVLMGILVGGPIGVGTVVIALLFGPLLQKYMTFIEATKMNLLNCRESE